MTITPSNLRRLAALAAATATIAAAAAPAPAAAKTINVTEDASLHLTRRNGSTLYERGTARGTISGPVTAVFNVGITRVTGKVTVFSGRNALTFTLSGTPTGQRGPRATFKGTMRVVGGTRRYRNASGTATFTGTVNRRTWAATVRASGRLSY